LLLLKEEDLRQDAQQSRYLNKVRQQLERLALTPTEVISDYLRALWEHAVDQILLWGDAERVDHLPFRVVLTIPAFWPPYARAAMWEGAERAGILADRPCGSTTLELVSEPEAAALAILNEPGTHYEVETPSEH
jgi:molecular chaperone DnaK (HSP70)